MELPCGLKHILAHNVWAHRSPPLCQAVPLRSTHCSSHARRWNQRRCPVKANCSAARRSCLAAAQSARSKRRWLPAWACPPAEPSCTTTTARELVARPGVTSRTRSISTFAQLSSQASRPPLSAPTIHSTTAPASKPSCTCRHRRMLSGAGVAAHLHPGIPHHLLPGAHRPGAHQAQLQVGSLAAGAVEGSLLALYSACIAHVQHMCSPHQLGLALMAGGTRCFKA